WFHDASDRMPAGTGAPRPPVSSLKPCSDPTPTRPDRPRRPRRRPIPVAARCERAHDRGVAGVLPRRAPDLSVHPREHPMAAENELNDRPRRVLQDRPPATLFGALPASQPTRVVQRSLERAPKDLLRVQPEPTSVNRPSKGTNRREGTSCPHFRTFRRRPLVIAADAVICRGQAPAGGVGR